MLTHAHGYGVETRFEYESFFLEGITIVGAVFVVSVLRVTVDGRLFIPDGIVSSIVAVLVRTDTATGRLFNTEGIVSSVVVVLVLADTATRRLFNTEGIISSIVVVLVLTATGRLSIPERIESAQQSLFWCGQILLLVDCSFQMVLSDKESLFWY